MKSIMNIPTDKIEPRFLQKPYTNKKNTDHCLIRKTFLSFHLNISLVPLFLLSIYYLSLSPALSSLIIIFRNSAAEVGRKSVQLSADYLWKQCQRIESFQQFDLFSFFFYFSGNVIIWKYDALFRM